MKAGWLVTQVTAAPDAEGRAGTSELEMHLNGPVTLAVSIFDNPEAERVLSRSGVPVVTLGDKTECRLKGCFGHVRFDRRTASEELAAAAKAVGVGTALQIGVKGFDDIGAAFKTAGIKISKRIVQVPSGGRMPEAVAAAVCEEFLSKCRMKNVKCKMKSAGGGKNGSLPDMIYFSDDFACAGALAAFSKAGVRVPEDVCVATWANAGNVPAFAGELTRVEMDPEGDAEKLADVLIARLEGRDAAFPATFGPTFVKGGTL